MHSARHCLIGAIIFGFSATAGMSIVANVSVADDAPDNKMSIVGAVNVVVDATTDRIQTPTNAALSVGARTQAAQGEMLALEPTLPTSTASVTLPDPTRRTADSRAADQAIETNPRRRGVALPQVS